METTEIPKTGSNKWKCLPPPPLRVQGLWQRGEIAQACQGRVGGNAKAQAQVDAVSYTSAVFQAAPTLNRKLCNSPQIFMAADMHVNWLPDSELVRVQFFEAVEHITDEEFDFLEKMKMQPQADVDAFMSALDSMCLALCDAPDDECAEEEEEGR